MGQAPHIVGPHRCVLVVLGLVLAGAVGVILVGRADVRPLVATALLCLGGVGQHCQKKVLLRGGNEGAHFA